MKKFILAVAFLLGLSVLFVSCNKDNGGGNYSKAIIGTWKVVDNDEDHTYTYEFRTDGTFIYILHYSEDSIVFAGQDVKAGPYYYKINGNKLEIGALGYVIIQKLTEAEMVWYYPEQDDIVTLTRVK